MAKTSRKLQTNSSSVKQKYWYILLAAIRVALVLCPQTGYIHPDEYFQTTDVLAGEVFQVHNEPAWEFNKTNPIRSMAISYFTIGLSYICLRDIGNLLRDFFLVDIVKPYFLLVAPRLLMCAMSFIIDYCLYKICTNNNEKYQTRLIILSSCYVTLIFGTRTFSNTFEMVLFALLLYFVCESQTFSNMLSRKKDYINYRYEVSKTIVEKAKFHKLKLYLISDSYRNCFIVSTITVLGFFNRPTFLAFAIMPVFFWVYRGFGNKSVTVIEFHTRILFLAICSLPTFVFVIVVDSFFYGYISWGEIGMLDVSINSFVFTPLNFLKYNIDSGNLAHHGLHPRWLHVFVNVPLLFTLLGVFAIFFTLKYMYLTFRLKFNDLPNIKSLKCLMIVSYIVPLVLLSIFPHQEPRFLIPILLPLVYLYGTNIFLQPHNVLVKTPEGSIQEKPSKTNFKNKVKSSNLFLITWLVINIVLAVFFGFLHQGGIYFATSYLQRDLSLTSNNVEYHIIYSHIYSLPEAFLLQRAPKIPLDSIVFNTKQEKRLHLYAQGSSKEIDQLVFKVNQIETSLQQIKPDGKRYKIYLLLPCSLTLPLEKELENNHKNFKKLEVFYPHISMEAFPSFKEYFNEITQCFIGGDTKNCIFETTMEFLGSFGLSLYEIKSK